MSEDLTVDVELVPVEDEVLVEEAIPSEVEQEAMDKGWNPDGAEGRRNLSADEYLDRQPLYDKIHKSERTVKRMQESQTALQQHLETLQKNLNTQRVDDLKQQKLKALEEQEHDRVMEIDEKIIEIHQEPTVQPQPDTVVFDNWADKNTWYDNDPKMKRYADALGAEYANTHGTLDASILDRITAETKEAFPDISTRNRSKPSSVEGTNRGTTRTKGSKHTVNDLDDMTKGVMRTLVRDGTYENNTAYIEALEQSGYFN